MSIIKHTIPILEYDTNPYAVIDPTHEKLDLDLPFWAIILISLQFIIMLKKWQNLLVRPKNILFMS